MANDMTLPEHAICSFMLAQLGAKQRYGNRGVAVVVVAGISPDLDTASKLVSDAAFWKLHHALGHSLLSISVLAFVIAGIAWWLLRLRPFGPLLGWCWTAAAVHCITDALYWWGVQPLWPFSSDAITWNIIEYLDSFVLLIWLGGAFVCWRRPDRAFRIAIWTLSLFAAYIAIRAVLPKPTGWLQFLTGGWMYEAPPGTPFLEWW
jgi:membrane-bound metal-dependent hydrolase YbcI (DUF457 family)